ncbi:MAG: class I SAM-dependent methyltransferase [Desulfobacterales bacterium]|nr:class I SAM-dependent methyltransferase [Desulfobacterales bacterium]
MAEQRTKEQLRQHYLIEKELAGRLRAASPAERKKLYSSLYEELFRRVPDHPQLTEKKSPGRQQASIRNRLKLFENLLTGTTSFLEVGPGDCGLSFEVARRVRQVYGLDVSETITSRDNLPENFQLILADGCGVPLPENSIDLAYSNQLMEHLHPDDALRQLKNIFTVLVPGGRYICITPNRLNGPHDISKYFDRQATGFHLREYTVGELTRLFRAVGFNRLFCFIGGRGRYLRVSPLVPLLVEALLGLVPAGPRRVIADLAPVRALINIRLMGIK